MFFYAISRHNLYFLSEVKKKEKSIVDLFYLRFLKIFLYMIQVHEVNSYYIILENFWKQKLFFINSLLYWSSFLRQGFFRVPTHVLVLYKCITWRVIRYFKCLPIRCFRSRTNSKTNQLRLYNDYSIILKKFFIRRRTLKERALLFKKKLKTIQKKKSITKLQKKKGPVIRSRDSKKSVWR